LKTHRKSPLIKLFEFHFAFPAFVFSVLVLCPALFSSAQANPSIKDFKGFQLSFFNELSGDRYLRLDYDEVLTEKPKIGFLKFGLPFLKVRDLSIFLDSRHIDSGGVAELFEKVSKSKGIRYAVAEPMSLSIASETGLIRIKGEKGKFAQDGSISIWGGVVLEQKQNKNYRSLDNLTISIDPLSNRLSIECPSEIPTITIPFVPNSRKNP
tara:strand:+ start:424 stop:1053 length:630 start_codon:yes stop_codon:yes gene_type:complete